MKVCEIFKSIQGESSYAGMPCLFIRLTGCNLRCTYCDTKYAYFDGEELSEDNILNKVHRAGIKLVEITGGEPLLQREVYQLIKTLLDDGYKVLLETNGSISIRDVDRRAVIILDIKTPGSGMNKEMDFSNFDYIKKIDEIKFVITDRRDYEWSKEIIQNHNLKDRCHILISPAYGIMDPEELAKWILEDSLDVRLNLQLHKYIFKSENNLRT
ncbi:MAG: radical SAM protein [Nitrospirae bacterium]|nr:radical SAM protein [Nitrospirota bacterium]